MEEEYTGFNDWLNRPIYHKSLVRSYSGYTYVIQWDEELGYVLIDIKRKTIEKLTPFVSPSLSVIPRHYETSH